MSSSPQPLATLNVLPINNSSNLLPQSLGSLYVSFKAPFKKNVNMLQQNPQERTSPLTYHIPQLLLYGNETVERTSHLGPKYDLVFCSHMPL